ncbi:radical SAM protein [uncultured Treponema sp.]|uniref:B12-binding domain-containing radical SAM protein n=1 Tax=uncultured Treponema sp. TaxID=162155 RepID=UPI0025FAD819|nr:radical SAM protein [uncultured Treponema sp.]
MNILILQPPIVQLNTAYPSGAYLSAFFKSLGHKTRWLDLSLELYYEIFSRAGLTRLFSLCSENALKLADKAEQAGDEATAFNLRRYVAQKDLWINWIDFITAILRPGKHDSFSSGYENAHRFVFGAHVPRGSRMENYLANLTHDLTTDDARSLASFALADLADFIAVAFDKNFSLVRYAESLTVSESSFSEVEKGADSPILKEFYEPLLQRFFMKGESLPLATAAFASSATPSAGESPATPPKTLVLISIPFAGTFAAALATGRFFKNHFKDSVYVSFGGGFVNTELRDTNERKLVDYCDAICYDRGYASYRQLLMQNADCIIKDKPIYKLRQFIRLTSGSTSIIEPLSDESSEEYKRALAYEREITSSLIPDFSDIDFSQYPRLIDDTNPMHRLWSDGSWIKAYMAHGCYWHKCAFCDVTLDYVKGYCPTNVSKLYEGLLAQCKEKGIYGIHFVDEAMPPAMMIAFARENIAHGSPITWWGNVRFEKSFTRDVADFLAYGGLIGVSAGLESATGNGLNAIHKGTDLESIVGACCAFKEAGILVHAYMIYGYWWEKPEDLINSMETLRQFYANGLLDSCFWHKFVLPRHSRVYKEWTEGKIPDLKPIDPQEKQNAPLFAKNGLHFEGEKKSEKYGAALDFSLNQWMHGEGLEKPVQKWFDFSVPHPTVPKNFIENLIAKYEAKRDQEFKEIPASNHGNDKSYWLGGEKIPLSDGKIGWFYMGEFHTAKKNAPESAFRGKGLCILP